MGATDLEVADIIHRYADAYRLQVGGIPPPQERVMKAITLCRTEALGGHLYVCDACGVLTGRYNSCRNRHCPKCQWLAKAQWLEARTTGLLPVPYFHVVFTVPAAIAAIAYQNKRAVYAILFRAASETLRMVFFPQQEPGMRQPMPSKAILPGHAREAARSSGNDLHACARATTTRRLRVGASGRQRRPHIRRVDRARAANRPRAS